VRGLTSHILFEKDDRSGSNVAITWVDVQPGAEQPPHHHAPEQFYVIVRGHGIMRVGDERREMGPGDAVFIPPNVTHGIENTGSEVLSYVSASTPSFSITAAYDAEAQQGR
jgi:mannose-6-phosphate isomerase-like protein (cupin superfamily)